MEVLTGVRLPFSQLVRSRHRVCFCNEVHLFRKRTVGSNLTPSATFLRGPLSGSLRLA